jgi:hypothetical protein
MPRRVNLHLGLPKTGTTYLQRALWDSRERLAASGTLYPGRQARSQRLAAYDLLGRRLTGAEATDVAGAWRGLMEEIAESRHENAIVSDELLVHSRRRQLRRIVTGLAPAEVNAVITVRDLGRALRSMWQYEVLQGATWQWPEFLEAARDPRHGRPTAGVGFWLRYDLERVVGSRRRLVPADRIHVVVLPQAGTSPERLLELFSAAVGVEPGVIVPPPDLRNRSVGVPETEVLRRLNLAVGVSLNETQRLRVYGVLRRSMQERPSNGELAISEEHYPWLAQRSESLIEYLRTSGCHVYGELADLRPDLTPAAGEIDPGLVPNEELLDATSAALEGLTRHYADFWQQARRRSERTPVAAATRVASSTRAFRFSTKAKVFELADRNRLFAYIARLYLRSSAPSDRSR